jgi:predicted flavoprotein YhiN
VAAEVARPRGTRSMSTHLKSRLGIDGLKAALLHEVLSKQDYTDHGTLAATLKRLPLRLRSARPVAEAISTAGEMLDWEAPTGGYLLTACMASGVVAGEGAAAWLKRQA